MIIIIIINHKKGNWVYFFLSFFLLNYCMYNIDKKHFVHGRVQFSASCRSRARLALWMHSRFARRPITALL